MSDKNEAIEEYKSGISKWWVITGILLFPLVPFALIYLNKKINKYVRGALIVIWFIVLCGVYQFACIKQGPVIKSISVPVSTISMKVGTSHQISYESQLLTRKELSLLFLLVKQQLRLLFKITTIHNVQKK